MIKALLIPVAAFAIVASAVLLFASAQDNNANAGAGSAQNIAIDMDPTGNTATSLGTVENCARLNNNDILDADEDNLADHIAFDVTVTGIPAEFAAQGFGTDIVYDKGALTIESVNVEQLLAVNAGSVLLNSSDAVPDTSTAPYYSAGAIDTSGDPATNESGSGVLARLGISAEAGANPAQYLLQFNDEGSGPSAVTIDGTATGWQPDSITEAFLAVDMECGTTPPPPPTASPTPTPPPFVKGDIQCDGDVDSVDALMIQRDIADLNVTQQPGCPAIGGPAARVASQGSAIFGDINCNGAVDAVDSLFILRFVAGLSVNLPGGCSPIGQ